MKPELVFQKRQDSLTAEIVVAALIAERSANLVGLLPLMLIFVELLDVQQRVLVVRIEAEHLVERFEGAIDKTAALEVETEAQKDVRLFEPRQPRPLQQALVDVDGARDLPLLAGFLPAMRRGVERFVTTIFGHARVES